MLNIGQDNQPGHEGICPYYKLLHLTLKVLIYILVNKNNDVITFCVTHSQSKHYKFLPQPSSP